MAEFPIGLRRLWHGWTRRPAARGADRETVCSRRGIAGLPQDAPPPATSARSKAAGRTSAYALAPRRGVLESRQEVKGDAEIGVAGFQRRGPALDVAAARTSSSTTNNWRRSPGCRSRFSGTISLFDPAAGLAWTCSIRLTRGPIRAIDSCQFVTIGSELDAVTCPCNSAWGKLLTRMSRAARRYLCVKRNVPVPNTVRFDRMQLNTITEVLRHDSPRMGR